MRDPQKSAEAIVVKKPVERLEERRAEEPEQAVSHPTAEANARS